ncbi:MAG: T9SS type A sorting domain-containing protein [Fluviicola sp.]
MSTKYKSILLFIAICLQSTYFGQSNTPCGAPVLATGASCTNTAGTTVGATFQSNAANGGNPTCASPGAPDVWYQFVAPAGGSVNIQLTAGTITDSGMGLYNGPCGSPTQISCDDDGGAGLMSQINATGLTPGVTYFIRVWQFSSGTGTFSICLQTPPPPPTNVNCSIPNPICSGSPINFTAQANGTAASTVNPGNNYGCLFTSPNPSWYYLQIAVGGSLVVDITAGSDVDYAIWGPFPSVANAIANCNSYGVPTDCSYSPSPTEQVNIPVLAGQTYVLLVTNFAAVVQTIDINDAVANTATTDCSIVPLSINLSTFTATRTNGLVELSWVTMSESNNDYFIVERSYDGEIWSVVDYVDGAGNSSPKLYNLEDRNAKNTNVYYRIKQFDFDGKSTTSSSIVVSDYLENNMTIYPNPAKNQLNVIAPFEFNQIELIDIQGEVIKTITVENTLQSFVDLTEMKDGMYFIKVTDGVKLSNQRFVINK